jgi:magnesium chelatase family protein
VPTANAQEALLVPGAKVWAVSSFAQLCAWLRGYLDDDDLRPRRDPNAVLAPDAVPDLADVVGQDKARRALEIAAAGGHHLYLSGPPGVGKTMLAERLPGILPALTDEQAMEVTAIHSVAGRLAPGRPLITQPPFSAPHHSASMPAIVGGGSGIAGPGEISLAHRGVLFLDEAPEFNSRVLDALRQPLESGRIVLSRSNGVSVYPAQFLLVLAANPCPCSAGGQSVDERQCICPAGMRTRYQSRLSGPLRDRIDLLVHLDRVSRRVLADEREGEPSAVVRERVAAARTAARRRLAGTAWTVNGDVPGPTLRRRWPIEAKVLRAVGKAADGGRLSTRGIDRVLRVAWTLADLAGRDRPGHDEVQEALDLRLGTWTPRPAEAVPA